jgi:hypothetical protein
VNTKSQIISVGLLLTVAGAASAASFDARNSGMGGTGVASSRYDAASTTNPALLTNFQEDDDFSLIVPAIGGTISDEDDIVDSLDSINDALGDLAGLIDGQNPADIPEALELKDAIIA